MQKVIAKINLKAIKENALKFKTLSKGKLCAVVKADAYGHGAVETVNALSGVADFFAVALIEEGLAIRSATCGKKVLVFTPPTNAEEVLAISENEFIATVGDLRTARLVKAVAEEKGKKIEVHLKVNTGMNRYGASLQLLGKMSKLLFGSKNVRVTGVYSHLYGDRKTSLLQREVFLRAKRIVEEYFGRVTCHLSASYGTLLGKEFHFDAVRIGIGLYGYLPCIREEDVKQLGESLRLKKAMSVYAKVVQERKYSFGGLGYGAESGKEKRKGESVRVLRLGYADGVLRKKINGTCRKNENTNALCMDACIRFGRKGRGRYEPIMLDAQKTAEETGTIPYEVLCAVTHRAEFVYEYE